MIRELGPMDPDAPVVVIDIGNTTIAMGTWHAGEIKSPLTVPTIDASAFDDAFTAHRTADPTPPAATVIGSVVPDVLERVRTRVLAETDRDALVIGEVVPLPMEVAVDDPGAVGVDRVCAAAAAYEKLQQACAIVDFGTAVTVDLTDDDGTFLGGAILSGVSLQLRSLHEHAAALPQADAAVPERPFGRNTVEAMQTGVCRGICGGVRGIVEGYATHLKHWPHVIATGGDAAMLAPHCDFIDTLVSHLALRGVGLAYTKHLADSGA